MRYERSGIAVFILILFIVGSFYFDVASAFLTTWFPPSETTKFIVNSIIGSSAGVVSAAVALWGLGYQQKRYKREENRKEPDIHIEDWYPKENDIHISLSNLGEERVKNLAVLVLVKPLRHYIGPLTSTKDDIEIAIESRPAPLQRTGGRLGKNIDNYLQKERDISYEVSVRTQIMNGKPVRFIDESYSFPHLLETLSDEVKALTFKIVLTYNNIHSDDIETEEIFSFTTAIDHPDHILRRQELAPETTEFGTRIVTHPKTFEEMFKTSIVQPHGGVCPPTGFGFLSVESRDIEKLREEQDN